jgi:hypothetical protein
MNLRDVAEKEWATVGPSPTHDELKTAVLLRIADGVAVMAKNHTQLVDDRAKYERWWREGQEEGYALERRCAALRGVITKLKNQLKAKP